MFVFVTKLGLFFDYFVIKLGLFLTYFDTKLGLFLTNLVTKLGLFGWPTQARRQKMVGCLLRSGRAVPG